MSQPTNPSLSLALGRLRFAVVTSCWVIALTLSTQIVVWSLTAFTDLRYAEPAPPEDAKLIVEGKKEKKPPPAPKQSVSFLDRFKKNGEEGEGDEAAEGPALGVYDQGFMTAVTVSRALGLMAALIICPLIGLGVVLSVPAGAPRVERAVTALIVSMGLVFLALPLGGWFGMGWQQGTFSSYARMTEGVEAAREVGFGAAFYGRFLLLPVLSAVAFIIVGFRFSSAVEAVLLKNELGVDPELEAEASNVEASSLHGAGRGKGALAQALQASKKKPAKTKPKPRGMTQLSPGDMPKRLI